MKLKLLIFGLLVLLLPAESKHGHKDRHNDRHGSREHLVGLHVRSRQKFDEIIKDVFFKDTSDDDDDEEDHNSDWLFKLQSLFGQCNLNPCRNNGVCKSKGRKGFECDCPKPFKGKICERAERVCRRGICGHGECVLTSTRPFYECKCKDPFQPPDCQRYSVCEPNPCKNGGQCIKDGNDFDCQCSNGFRGHFCHIGPDDCYVDDGESYRGNASETENGNECLYWNSHFILNHGVNPFRSYEDKDGLGPHNFCRNPDGDTRPWCFYRKGLHLFWGYCDVKLCPKPPKPTNVVPTVVVPPSHQPPVVQPTPAIPPLPPKPPTATRPPPPKPPTAATRPPPPKPPTATRPPPPKPPTAATRPPPPKPPTATRPPPPKPPTATRPPPPKPPTATRPPPPKPPTTTRPPPPKPPTTNQPPKTTMIPHLTTKPTHAPTAPTIPATPQQFLTCGNPQPKKALTRIYGGLKVNPGAIPWQVSLQQKPKNSNRPYSHVCGGVLIKSCWVLTAGHCIDQNRDMQVVMGSLALDKLDAPAQVVQVENAIRHENYRETPEAVYNDIALLRLKGTEGFCANETQFVKTACLPDAQFPDGTECTISGWGATETSDFGSKHLLEANVLLINQEKCSEPIVYGHDIDNTMFCAGHLQGGVDSCQGDSGGPLTCKQNVSHVIYGLVSWGDQCGKKNKPGVYTRVTHFLNWIKSKTQASPV